MTRSYAEEDWVKKGLASLAVALGASEGDVAQIDADGNVTLAPLTGAATTHQTLANSGLLVPNGGTGYQIPWSRGSNTGDVLVDLTDPNYPTFIDAGVYAVTVYAYPRGPMTAGGRWSLDFELDFSGDAKVAGVDSAAADATVVSPQVSIAMTYYMPEGAQILAAVNNHDGVSTINFSGAMYIQRLA